jgi:cytochrome b pre-mRNA-processing protein 3
MIALGLGRRRRTAANLYAAAVAAARVPVFYRDLHVPDTIEGRYELIVLHVALLLRRLTRGASPAPRLAQAVVDIMAADLDRSIRELGVGDLSVGKFMKRMGEGLYGRASAYEAGLDDGLPAIEAALRRNVYAGLAPDGIALAVLARYVDDQDKHLAQLQASAIASGTVDFIAPPVIEP